MCNVLASISNVAFPVGAAFTAQLHHLDFLLQHYSGIFLMFHTIVIVMVIFLGQFCLVIILSRCIGDSTFVNSSNSQFEGVFFSFLLNVTHDKSEQREWTSAQ